jgi:hypothetical protein
VIGGTTPDNKYSPNYFITPRLAQPIDSDNEKSDDLKSTDSKKKILEFEYTVIPQLNCPRIDCSLYIFRDILFVLYGQGRKREKDKIKPGQTDIYCRDD